MAALGLALAALADNLLGLGWGYSWTAFFGSLGIFALSAVLGTLVLVVNGVFDDATD